MKLPNKNPDVVFRRVSEGAVLLSTTDEVYFGLNEVGAFIWEQLDAGLENTAALGDALAREYPDVDASTIEADMHELLDELLRVGLLSNGPGQKELAG